MLVKIYVTMISRIETRCYFLRDAVKDALILELMAGKHDLVVELCNYPQGGSTKREILTEVLTEYGEACPDKADEIIDRLIREERHIDTALVLIEVAYNLDKIDILEHMARHRDSAARRAAVQFIHYVWRDEPDQAFRLLRRLSTQVRNWLLPDFRILMSCIDTSVLVLLEGFENPKSVETLRTIWVDVLNKLLYRDLDDVKVIGSMLRSLRESTVKLASYGLWRVLAHNLEEDSITTYDRKDFENFYKNVEAQSRVSRLMPYFDVSLNLEDAWDDLLAIVQNDDLISVFLMMYVLTVHGMKYDERILSPSTNPVIPFVKRLYDHAILLTPSPPAVPYLLMTLGGMGRSYEAEGVDDELINIFDDCLAKYYAKHECVSTNSLGHELKATGFGFYIQLFYIKDANLNSELLATTIQDALNHGHFDFLERYVNDIADFSARRRTWAMLRGLRPILTALDEINDKGQKSRLETALVQKLSRIRIYASREVDQFLDTLDDEDDAINRIRKQVQASGQKETLGSMSIGRLSGFSRSAILENSNRFILEQFYWWLSQIVECQDFATWLSLLVRAAINFIYVPDNESVFKTPDLLTAYREATMSNS